MINEVLVFLRDQLNQHLKGQEVQEDRVVFLAGDNKPEVVSFPNNAIVPLLINLEEEHTLRAADPYMQTRRDGTQVSVNPAIRLNLYVLFVSHFNAYEESLKYLAHAIRFFQRNRFFDHERTPELTSGVDRLVMELVTMPFTSQNEIWNALRTTYLPSVLYKVKMIVFEDEEPVPAPVLQEPAVISTTAI